MLARAATASHCKDWLYLQLTGERVTDVSEGTFTFGDFRTRAYAPRSWRRWAWKASGGFCPRWSTAAGPRTS